MCANLKADRNVPREGYIPLENAELYYREIGQGQPVIVLHGGPDFNHSYLLPDMDRLTDDFRLIYYDQRGRGKSAGNVQPEDVTIESDIEDLDRVRKFFQLETIAVLGHSWGGVLALEYAVRYPYRVSHLVLMNTAPASHYDAMLTRENIRHKRESNDVERMKALASSQEYDNGDPDTVAEYYRIHFKATLKHEEHLDIVIGSLSSSFTREGILKAREIEEQLMSETWARSDYSLFTRLEPLNMAVLVIHGDNDFIPAECAARVARAIRGARFVLLGECGHFSYLERWDDVRKEMIDFFYGTLELSGSKITSNDTH